jgi:zinc transporter ZupT
MAAPVAATVVGIGGAALGLRLTEAHQRVQVVVPFSAGLLLGVAVLGLLPELGSEVGWLTSLSLFAVGYGLLFLVDRLAYPVCPTCAHNHDHDSCSTELHGFAWPLIVGAALHSFLDGWSIAAAGRVAPLGLRVAVPLAILLHKAPEGLALGGVLRASVKSRGAAFAWCALAEGATLAGGALGLATADRIGIAWIDYPLGITAGWLAYLGYHAVHQEWKRRGAAPAFGSALAGIAGAAALQRGVEQFFR